MHGGHGTGSKEEKEKQDTKNTTFNKANYENSTHMHPA